MPVSEGKPSRSLGAADLRSRHAAVIRGARILQAQANQEPEVAEVGRIIAACIEGGAGRSIDEALNLRRRGGVSVRRALEIGARDSLLRNLAREHPDWSGLEPAVVARQMRTAFGRYEAGRWLRDRDRSAPPPDEPAMTFWRLLQAGHLMPKERQLQTILTDAVQTPV